METCYLLIYGDLPTPERLQEFNNKIAASAELTQEVVETLRSLPKTTHPMAALACGIQSLGGAYPTLASNNRSSDLEKFDDAACLIISAIRSIAAAQHRFSMGMNHSTKDSTGNYCEDFCHLCFLVMGMMKSQKQSVRH